MSDKTVTMADVAKAAKVSVMTVSRALRTDYTEIKPETRLAIMAAAREIGYPIGCAECEGPGVGVVVQISKEGGFEIKRFCSTKCMVVHYSETEGG